MVRIALAVVVGCAGALTPLVVDPAGQALLRVAHLPGYPHEAHSFVLAETGLHRDPMSLAWVDSAQRALQSPESVALPFASERAVPPTAYASGYAFAVPAGRRIRVSVRAAGAPNEVFVDLFRRSGVRLERIAGGLPGSAVVEFGHDAAVAGDYVLRVQLPLGEAASVVTEVASTALLAFPVTGVDERAIWSGFGAEREGGRRAHRGADIFAPRGTPAVAATDAWVTRVETTRVGGNVVWLQPLFGNVRLYYAHLDEQWVAPGEFVHAGQPVGAVGNTGNAVTTPPHLHFGVYVRQPGVRGGAQDPVLFLR